MMISCHTVIGVWTDQTCLRSRERFWEIPVHQNRPLTAMENVRVYALQKLLDNQSLEDGDRLATIKTLVKKSAILAQGAEKRAHFERAAYYRGIGHRYLTE
ncbi:MAG: hypothetical protein KZQ66_18875 [Candidatus Thiodiazotropha sp. (ex Lucinoma aequizonata)]|nr:hypothetical protein [Candidatus Thiodiazotropha sp. (ex Lucinoma aequizonata)]MCU7903783.1 hypothetical protein [Candidatus Thiodiazotropha sp. (ex Lucinoma aequizonata)]